MCPLMPLQDEPYIRQRHLEEAMNAGARPPKELKALGNLHFTAELDNQHGLIYVTCHRCVRRFVFSSGAVSWAEVYDAMLQHREESCMPGASVRVHGVNPEGAPDDGGMGR